MTTGETAPERPAQPAGRGLGGSVTIREALSAADYADFGALIAEYVGWCRERYATQEWLVDIAISHQSLDRELEALGTSYGPPNGFRRMVLDTTRDMTEAIGLYRSFGFADCAPYIDYPDRMKPMMVFMQKPLGSAP